MKTEIEEAIKTLVKKAADTKNPAEALHLTQAALNLAHVAQVAKQVDAA